MYAVNNMFEEAFGILQIGTLRSDPSDPSCDDLTTTCFPSMKYEPYLGKTHTYPLAGLNNAQTMDVFPGVLPMP